VAVVGRVALSTCFDCGLAGFGVGVEGVASSPCFGCGVLPAGAGAATSADSAEAGGGIVIVGFLTPAAGLEAVPGGGSRCTGVSGPAPAGGLSQAAEGCGLVVVAGSSARDSGTGRATAAEISSITAAVCSQRVSRRCRLGECGMATPVYAFGQLFVALVQIVPLSREAFLADAIA
jgi:hypothetical protein